MPKGAPFYTNYRHPELFHSQGMPMELDVFCPQYNIAFEYQGGEHYHSFYHGALPSQLRRDSEKRTACEHKKISLIDIPFWWDGNAQSLAATIHQHRPDIPLDVSYTAATPISSAPSLSLPNTDKTGHTPIPDYPPNYRKARDMVNQNPSSVFVKVFPYSPHTDPTHQ